MEMTARHWCQLSVSPRCENGDEHTRIKHTNSTTIATIRIGAMGEGAVGGFPGDELSKYTSAINKPTPFWNCAFHRRCWCCCCCRGYCFEIHAGKCKCQYDEFVRLRIETVLPSGQQQLPATDATTSPNSNSSMHWAACNIAVVVSHHRSADEHLRWTKMVLKTEKEKKLNVQKSKATGVWRVERKGAVMRKVLLSSKFNFNRKHGLNRETIKPSEKKCTYA